ncbi:unnamed protein product [Macrosiphum euphorbiae]|uniref:Uncharacterized protein n=1 Tax=Macrosiphum euphorbiae TaxID=13131 RepID=A0AAV0VXN7_9HEMI|nr:unnamed protein product [Macrosiphum euphorbiae]
MVTIRLCFTATVAFLVVAIGLKVASSMNNIVWAMKSCPVDRMYDPEGRFCRPAGTGVDEYEQRLMNRLRSGFRMAANVRLKSIYEWPPYCFSTDVLVDVPAEEVRGLMEAHQSQILLPMDYWFDLTPSDELVAQTCRPRDQYCGRGNYTCVNKCGPVGFIFVDDSISLSEMPFTLSAYETDPEGRPVGRSNNTVLQNYDRHSCAGVISLIDDRFMLTMDGNLFLIHEGDKWILPAKDFCLEYLTEGGTPAVLRAFLCTNAKPPVSFLFWVKTLSVVCLVLTLIVYSTLPYLRNTHGYYVMFYMACQLVYFVLDLIYDLVQDDINNPLCIPFGMSYLFFFF